MVWSHIDITCTSANRTSSWCIINIFRIGTFYTLTWFSIFIVYALVYLVGWFRLRIRLDLIEDSSLYVLAVDHVRSILKDNIVVE